MCEKAEGRGQELELSIDDWRLPIARCSVFRALTADS